MKNKLLQEYFQILCNNDYPDFIDKYLQTEEMQRIKYIGQFCGCDYAIYHPLFFYSRYDHSVATALMAWHFTKDKTQTLCALFHDLGTPCFSHCIDYLLGDIEKQESSEKNVYEIITKSKLITQYLKDDNIAIENLKHPEKYSIIENEKPKLCVDRLDGVLHTVLIWLHTHSMEQIRKVYEDISVLKNENNTLELGFNHIEIAELFFNMVYVYSVELQSNRAKFELQFVADCLKKLIDNQKLLVEQLYTFKEVEIVQMLKNELPEWAVFEKANEVKGSSEELEDCYFVCVKAKKRYVVPLCSFQNEEKRLNEISKECSKLLEEYLQYEDEKYAYIPEIKIETI